MTMALRRRLQALARRRGEPAGCVPRDGWPAIWGHFMGERDERGEELVRRHRLDTLLRSIMRGPGGHDEP